MPSFPLSASTKRLTMLAGLVVACGLLAACGAGSAESAKSSDVTYKAWTEGGNLKSVRHDYVDGLNGAVSLPAEVSGAKWSRQEDGGHTPRLKAVPTDKGVAHCLLRDGDGRVLDQQKGAAGRSVTCSAKR
ncbi:hypothetical protein IPZ61_01500 [Streptomyces sioyaensis]|uniref:hypothetical protein n=1 Tax=Streptomyces sioyaensis TaxID=67364 RepID=UPI001F447C4D|nr:hypothetical protein [Streptomyces sioyaensis]MCF3172017.1 hypothetical protein [Streptomyces sioyaensis]